MSRSHVLPVFTIAAVATLPSACGDTESEAIADPAGPPTGRSIIDGIHVPPGTELVGDVFAHRVPAEDPHLAPPITTIGPGDHGMASPIEPPAPSDQSDPPPAEPEPTPPPRDVTVEVVPASPAPAYVEVKAVLLVTGDPIKAFASLLEQAEAAGIPMLTYAFVDDDPAFCRVSEADADPQRASQVYALDVDLPDGDLELGCDAFGTSNAKGESQRELDVTLNVSERAEPFQSFLTVTHRSYQPTGAPVTSVLWRAGAYAPAPLPHGPSPVTPPALPDEGGRPGDPLTGDWEWGYDGAAYQVLEGSRRPAPAMPVTSASSGFVTVVEVAEVEPMIDQYYDQISEFERSSDETFEYDGATTRYVACDCGGGGGSLTITATQRPGQPGYLLIERHTD